MLEGQLMDEARRRTALTDFGEDSFREPLERLVDSINRESGLNAFGAAALPEMLIASLVNRLEIEDWYRRHPEIDDEEIVAPLFIVGLPRTGSTLLSSLLALDPQTRSLRYWEGDRPCPPPEPDDGDDPRIAACQAGIDGMLARHPEMRDMLPYGASAPNECHPLLFLEFAAISYEGFVHVPAYMAWLSDPARDHSHAYRYHKRALKLLQWRHGPRRWQLKSPVHSLAIDGLAAVYPDAHFVVTHRDPVKVLPSVCSLMTSVRSDFLDDPMKAWLGPALLEAWAMRQERLADFRARTDPARFHDVWHQDTVSDPVATVRSLYAGLGWDFTDALATAIDGWREDNPRGTHKPTLGDYGLTRKQVAARFAFYDWQKPQEVIA